MLAFVKRLFSDESGLETVEYAVMTAMIVAAIVTGAVALGGAVGGRFSELATYINTLVTP